MVPVRRVEFQTLVVDPCVFVGVATEDADLDVGLDDARVCGDVENLNGNMSDGELWLVGTKDQPRDEYGEAKEDYQGQNDVKEDGELELYVFLVPCVLATVTHHDDDDEIKV